MKSKSDLIWDKNLEVGLKFTGIYISIALTTSLYALPLRLGEISIGLAFFAIFYYLYIWYFLGWLILLNYVFKYLNKIPCLLLVILGIIISAGITCFYMGVAHLRAAYLRNYLYEKLIVSAILVISLTLLLCHYVRPLYRSKK